MNLGMVPIPPEVTIEEIKQTPPSFLNKFYNYVAESVGFGKKAKEAEKSWNQ